MIKINLIAEGRKPVVARQQRAAGPKVPLLSGENVATWMLVLGVIVGVGIFAFYFLTLRGTINDNEEQIREARKRVEELREIIRQVEEFERKEAELKRKIEVITELKNNQRGPVEMGWRTNAKNLNLNRDYAKLDTPEVRGVVAAINAYEPDLYFDLHVTDGSDYQYDVTFGFTGPHGYSPAIAGWLKDHLERGLMADLTAAGHIPGPLIFAADDRNPAQGLLEWTSPPRFSNGYGDARHLPTLLVENHSLKPYDQRVLGTYVLLESALRTLGRSRPTTTDPTATTAGKV